MAAPTTKTLGARFDSLEQEAFLSLWRTYDRLRAFEDALFAQFELTSQQYNVLRLLGAPLPGSMPTLTLAEKLVSRAPDITRILDRLESRGLVRRDRRAVNRRVVEVTLTSAGIALLDQIAIPLVNCHRRQLGHMKKRDLKQLVDLLRMARGPHETTSIWK